MSASEPDLTQQVSSIKTGKILILYFVSKKYTLFMGMEKGEGSVKPHYISPDRVEVCAKKCD